MLGMANMSAIDATSEAQPLAVQIMTIEDGFGELGLGVGAGLATFGGLQAVIDNNSLRGGSGWCGGRYAGVLVVKVGTQGTAARRRL